MREAMEKGKEGREGKWRFLIDGFPRQMDQAIKFDESVSLLRPLNSLLCKKKVLTGICTAPHRRSVFRPSSFS